MINRTLYFQHDTHTNIKKNTKSNRSLPPAPRQRKVV